MIFKYRSSIQHAILNQIETGAVKCETFCILKNTKNANIIISSFNTIILVNVIDFTQRKYVDLKLNCYKPIPV